MKRQFTFAALFSLSLMGCASMRGVEVQSDTTESYAINVTNLRNAAVVVSYEGGGASRELGTVGAGRTERFVVISTTPAITLYTRSSSGAALNSYPVTLTRPDAASVAVR